VIHQPELLFKPPAGRDLANEQGGGPGGRRISSRHGEFRPSIGLVRGRWLSADLYGGFEPPCAFEIAARELRERRIGGRRLFRIDLPPLDRQVSSLIEFLPWNG
jgi:hypothetical protein